MIRAFGLHRGKACVHADVIEELSERHHIALGLGPAVKQERLAAEAVQMRLGAFEQDAEARRADLVEGSRIENGKSRTLGPGDVILIPAGVPHWFGITGERLVLLGIKLPKAD